MQHYCAACGCEIPSGSYCPEHVWVGFESIAVGNPIEEAFPAQCPTCEVYQCTCGWRLEHAREGR